MRPDWPSRVIDALHGLKRQGLDFDTAWAVAMRRHPPRARDMPYRPTLLPEPGESESMQEFVYRTASDAWHGRRPALANFGPSLLLQAMEEGVQATSFSQNSFMNEAA